MSLGEELRKTELGRALVVFCELGGLKWICKAKYLLLEYSSNYISNGSNLEEAGNYVNEKLLLER